MANTPLSAVLTMAFLSAGCFSKNQDAETWTLFPQGGVPGERAGVIGPEVLVPIPDGGGPGDQQYENVTVPTLEPFSVVKAAGKNGTAVVVAPGGGYSIVAWNREGTDIAKWLNSLGVSAFVLKYRVPARPWLPFGAAPLMDAQRAVSLLRSRAEGLGINASRIGFMGFSAGGHLTAHISTSFARRAYPHIDAVDNVSCRPNFALMVYPWALVDDDDTSKLMLNITAEHPTSFLAQAWDDPVHVENSLHYALALKAAINKSQSELHVYPKGGHGYGRCTVAPARKDLDVCTWPDRAARFLENLGVVPTPAVALV